MDLYGLKWNKKIKRRMAVTNAPFILCYPQTKGSCTTKRYIHIAVHSAITPHSRTRSRVFEPSRGFFPNSAYNMTGGKIYTIGWYRKAVSKSSRNSATAARESPHPGHGIPVKCCTGQFHPSVTANNKASAASAISVSSPYSPFCISHYILRGILRIHRRCIPYPRHPARESQ